MAAQESVPPLDRGFLKSSSLRASASAGAHTANKAAPLRKTVSAPTSPRKEASEKTKRDPFDYPPSRHSPSSWLVDFWASEAGVLVLEFWTKSKQWYRSHAYQLDLVFLAYSILFVLIIVSSSTTSQSNLDHLSDTLTLAGTFAESIDNGYLFESIPVELRNAGADLRVYYDAHADSSRNLRRHTQTLNNLLSELDGIDYHWKSFENSRDKAVTSVKEEVQASRAIFQAELERLGGTGNQWGWKGLGTQFVKILLLRNPGESKTHFTESNWMNITSEIENYIDVWRNKRMPELRYKLTSPRGGRAGGLPGLIKEVRESWPVKNSGNKKFRVAPVFELEDVAKKALGVLGHADGVYKAFWYAIQFLEKRGMKKKGPLGIKHLEILLGKFDESIKILEGAEWVIRERLGNPPNAHRLHVPS
ncbi:hypothetical protein BofuT4_P062710.1 [Botrytis cinerea T4]|uniref:Uncharacterized protein n=1 Tax=Botryotinia fuckeliana (strain T4) TaxID=999810 RepID=G2XTK5_BOTF4|nr:hypothetical protein BofuT4_P062710.1 [Botrytis cinerea T4]